MQNQRWSNFYKQDKDFQLISSQEIDRFLAYLPSNTPKTCLDIGCGTGQLTRELFHRGFITTGVDISSEAIERAKELTIVPESQLTYHLLDIESDTLQKMTRITYGLIVCKLVYAFIKDKPAFIEKVTSLLAPDGVFVVITPFVDDMPADKRSISSTAEDIDFLQEHFHTLTIYKHKGLTFFIGKKIPSKQSEER